MVIGEPLGDAVETVRHGLAVVHAVLGVGHADALGAGIDLLGDLAIVAVVHPAGHDLGMLALGGQVQGAVHIEAGVVAQVVGVAVTALERGQHVIIGQAVLLAEDVADAPAVHEAVQVALGLALGHEHFAALSELLDVHQALLIQGGQPLGGVLEGFSHAVVQHGAVLLDGEAVHAVFKAGKVVQAHLHAVSPQRIDAEGNLVSLAVAVEVGRLDLAQRLDERLAGGGHLKAELAEPGLVVEHAAHVVLVLDAGGGEGVDVAVRAGHLGLDLVQNALLGQVRVEVDTVLVDQVVQGQDVAHRAVGVDVVGGDGARAEDLGQVLGGPHQRDLLGLAVGGNAVPVDVHVGGFLDLLDHREVVGVGRGGGGEHFDFDLLIDDGQTGLVEVVVRKGGGGQQQDDCQREGEGSLHSVKTSFLFVYESRPPNFDEKWDAVIP